MDNNQFEELIDEVGSAASYAADAAATGGIIVDRLDEIIKLLKSIRSNQ
jgi:hypothetical protein